MKNSKYKMINFGSDNNNLVSDETFILTSESVSDGHPDKICDQISDAILDACLTQDPNSLVAAEVAVFNETVILGGEISSNASLNYDKIVREVIKNIGYDNAEYGIDYKTVEIINRINKQSQEIQDAVINNGDDLGAGDQGIMFGYATNESSSKLPIGLEIAHKLLQKHKVVRATNTNIKPDAKSQVSIKYDQFSSKPLEIDTILVSTQHSKDLSNEELYTFVLENIIEPVVNEITNVKKDNVRVIINPSGSFIVGGPKGDAGLTGRKIIVDTYGGLARHGGGAFSGKDATKVDRSAAYMARFVAINVINTFDIERCEIQLSYAIGINKPISINVDIFKDDLKLEKEIKSYIEKNFDLTPSGIIKALDLKKPIYSKTSTFGHFGKKDLN